MHVCFVLPPFEIYGPERGLALAIITSEVTAELRARGIDTTVISPSDGSTLYPGGDVIGIAYDPADPRPSPLARLRGKVERWDVAGYGTYVARVRSALGSLGARPDVLVLFNDLVTGGLLARHHRVPVLTWMQNEVSTNHRSGLRELARTDGVLAVSTYIAGRARSSYGPDAPPISVVPNGVNVSTFTPPRDPGSGATPEVRTCFVGRIDPHKGPLLAAQAVERAQARGHAVAIDVAGPVQAWGQAADAVDRYVAELEATLARTGGAWVGQVSRVDLPAFYRDHPVSFVPSTSPEPFGLVALEAMAAGCAVVASDRGGLPEVCGDAADLIDPEDAAAFDRALDRLLGDPQALAASRTAARRHAEERTWARTTDCLLDVIATVT